jgi:5-methylcytosine-specific restriction endonuclease McrA
VEQRVMTMGEGPPPVPLPAGRPSPGEVRAAAQAEVERFVHDLELEARAAIRRATAGAGGARILRPVFEAFRPANCMLILRAPHVDPGRARRLMDAYRHPDEERYVQVRRQVARLGRPASLTYVGHRAGWTCAICGRPVLERPPAGSRPHPLGPSLDHVIPIVCGGPDSQENVRLAHHRCNHVRNADHPETGGRPRAAAWRRLTTYEELSIQVALWERDHRGGREVDELREMFATRTRPAWSGKLQDMTAAVEARRRRPAPERILPAWYSAMAQEGEWRLAERRRRRGRGPAGPTGSTTRPSLRSGRAS